MATGLHNNGNYINQPKGQILTRPACEGEHVGRDGVLGVLSLHGILTAANSISTPYNIAADTADGTEERPGEDGRER